MGKYVLAYRGGAVEQDPAAMEAAMEKWMGWFASLGGDVADGGNPFGPSAAVGAGGTSGLTGYSILTAESLDDAVSKARGCPVVDAGGTVEVYEAVPMG